MSFKPLVFRLSPLLLHPHHADHTLPAAPPTAANGLGTGYEGGGGTPAAPVAHAAVGDAFVALDSSCAAEAGCCVIPHGAERDVAQSVGPLGRGAAGDSAASLARTW